MTLKLKLLAFLLGRFYRIVVVTAFKKDQKIKNSIVSCIGIRVKVGVVRRIQLSKAILLKVVFSRHQCTLSLPSLFYRLLLLFYFFFIFYSIYIYKGSKKKYIYKTQQTSVRINSRELNERMRFASTYDRLAATLNPGQLVGSPPAVEFAREENEQPRERVGILSLQVARGFAEQRG